MSTTDDNNDEHGGSEETISNKKECITCEQPNIDIITEDIESIAVLDMSTCAACGKEGKDSDMNTCNRCKMVKYCNAACKKKHRTKHKKKCDRRVSELFEEQLFKEVEPEECPICLLQLPLHANQNTFKSCCGKVICHGCIYAMKMSEGKDLCAFCRTPPPSSVEEQNKRMNKLMDKGNGDAFCTLSRCYFSGTHGLPQDYRKAHELWLKAGELGCADGYYNLGYIYHVGAGVERDMKKAKSYFELGAMGGDIHSRHNLGCLEGQARNHHRSMKHFMIAARAGYKESLDNVKQGFMNGFVTKDEYANTLRGYHERQKEIKSDERDKAAIHYA